MDTTFPPRSHRVPTAFPPMFPQGTIDTEELKAALKNAGREQTDAQIKQMMRICDEDGDGDIGFEEVRMRVPRCMPCPCLRAGMCFPLTPAHTSNLPCVHRLSLCTS